VLIAVVADSHFDESAGGRLDECVRVHQWIAEDLARRRVDLVLHAGDVFERTSTPRERREVANWIRAVTAVAPMVIVRGNHDRPGDLSLFARLQTRHPLVVEERAGVHHVAGCNIGALAWPTKASIVQLAESGQHGEQLAGDALRAVLRGLGAEMELGEGAPKVLLAHAMVRGSRVSTGQPLLGCDLEIGVEDLRLASASFYALGHIHCGQNWPGLDGDVVYPGSPRRTAFGETEEKGYVLVEFDGPRCVGWERIETPCAPMILLSGEWLPDHGLQLTGMEHARAIRGAEIRIRYAVDPEHRAAAAADADLERARFLGAGAAAVKLDPIVNPTTRARAPEVAAALTLDAKLRAYWKATSAEPEEARAGRLLGMAAAVEEAR